jgi:hypothetical protein
MHGIASHGKQRFKPKMRRLRMYPAHAMNVARHSLGACQMNERTVERTPLVATQ